MVYKPNWACTDCGMSSSRRESVIRHIANPRIHNGRAQAIPYTDYLVGVRNGIYSPSTAHLYRMRNFSNQLPDNQFEESLLDRIKKKAEERFIDTVAEKLVKPTYDQERPLDATAVAKSAYRIPQPVALSLPPESIFGIAGYICEHCLVIKPKIILFTSSVDNRFGLAEICPVQTCHRQGSDMSKEDEIFYLNHNKRSGYGTRTLTQWISGYWSHNTKMKIIAIRLPYPTAGKSPDWGVKIIVSDDRTSFEKMVLLRYDESVVLDLTSNEGIVPAQSVEEGSSIIMETIKNSEHMIEGDDQLGAFLRQTKFSTFAFFYMNQSKPQSENGKTLSTNEVYLVAALPYEVTMYKKFRIEEIRNN
jgi:hypothetical protein